TLGVTVAPAAPKLGPGEKTTLAVSVTDAAGKPVPDAEVAVIVLDQGIPSPPGDSFSSPRRSLYRPRRPPTPDPDPRADPPRASAKPARPDAAAMTATTTGAPGDGGGGGRFRTVGHGRAEALAAPSVEAPMPKKAPMKPMEKADKKAEDETGKDVDHDGIPDAT